MESVEPWSFTGGAGSLVRTRHFRFFTTTDDAMLAGIMPGFLETQLERYITELGRLPPPELKLDTFLLRDREQWDALTRKVMGPTAGGFLLIERGGFAVGGRSFLWNIGLRDTLSLAAHEGWHQYAQRALRDPLPIWLDEAIATTFEGLRIDPSAQSVIVPMPWANLERFDQLRRAADRGALLPLERLMEVSPKELNREDPEAALSFYAQSWALGMWLREGEGGTLLPRLTDLLRDAADGRLLAYVESIAGREAAERTRNARAGSGVLKAYIDADLSRASGRFAVFQAELLRPGARERVALGRSPIFED